jgi:hypothetical protein
LGRGVGGVVAPGVIIAEELIAADRPTAHEVEADLMFDRFDVRRITIDIVLVLTVGVREGPWRE